MLCACEKYTGLSSNDNFAKNLPVSSNCFITTNICKQLSVVKYNRTTNTLCFYENPIEKIICKHWGTVVSKVRGTMDTAPTYLRGVTIEPQYKLIIVFVNKSVVLSDSDTSESSDSDTNVVLADSDDDVSYFELEQLDPVILDIADVVENSFVLVKFATKKTLKYYIGQVVEIHSGQFEVTVNFLRKQGNNFIFPTIEDQSTIDFDNIVLHLPSPVQGGGTARANSLLRFNIDLQSYNIV